MQEGKGILIGHRGSAGLFPENTLVGFKRALGLGVRAFEFDVQLSHDGVPVLCHDSTVDRTTDGTGRVADYTWAQLQQLDAGSWFAKEYSEESVPSLEQVLNLLSGYKNDGLLVNIELKNGPVFYSGLDQAILNLINQFDIYDCTIISSFDHMALKKIRELDADVKVGVITASGIINPVEYMVRCKIDSYSYHPLWYFVTEKLIVNCKEKGIKVYPYTVNDKKEINQLWDWGVDGIITDYPVT
ncbi:glycerophosphoryl diester phosphodiesterase [Desulfitispora alkaliphila]|uniref:glycerophosphodiester phosphodiesterase n=1 Tax=Desulfitispora alkaliphila TaxID=622674 RepID=UPI003D212FF6